jgi:hypothetical protein
MSKKSTVNKAGNYTKPGMRKRIFQRIKAGSKGGPAGVWSARKAQMLAKQYKSAGGGYKKDGGIVRPKYENGGKAESQKSLDQWTSEEWDNVSGKKGDRYLPKTVREGMSSGQKAAENKKKRQATKSGKVKAEYSDSLKKSMRSKGVYLKGGKLKGPSHKEGGIPIEVEGGEYIIKKDSVNAKTLPILQEINNTGQYTGANSDYNFPVVDARERSEKK